MVQWIPPNGREAGAFVESFNGTFRDECLNEHLFLGVSDAEEKIGLPAGCDLLRGAKVS